MPGTRWHSLGLAAGLVGALAAAVPGVACHRTPQSPSCSYTVTPTTISLSEQGGTGTISVVTGGGCTWTATSNNAWLTVTAASTGAGSGAVVISAGPNGQTARSATAIVAQQVVTVSQAAAPPTFTLSGTVKDVFIGHGLAGVAVAVTGGPSPGSATTDLNGDYAITNLLAGTYTLSFTLNAYATATAGAAVPAAGALETAMRHNAPAPPTVTDLSGYWTGTGTNPNAPFMLLLVQNGNSFGGRYRDQLDFGGVSGTSAQGAFTITIDFGDAKLNLESVLDDARHVHGVQRTSALGNRPYPFTMTR